MLNSTSIDQLKAIQNATRERETGGLSDDVILQFLGEDPSLGEAIQRASERFTELQATKPELLALTERELMETLQDGFLNFYPDHSVSPYIPLASGGPWIITSHGAVVYDTGGYGMLGLGHCPEGIREVLARPQVMANIMTPSFSQHAFMTRLRERIGSGRAVYPFSKFVCMNSGSESMTVALRISDVHARIMTDPGARHAGKKIMFASLRGSFHGRTGRPAQVSNSTHSKYQLLASFRDRGKNAYVVEPNNVSQLEEVFQRADDENCYIEAVVMEPVMGEGNPGVAITPEFYACARALSEKHGSLLLIDSIQAGLRCHGVLSIIDYPGFEDLDPPDMEAYSKALNAGQFPLSVLALREHVAAVYQTGIYGNTMTTNPRALDVALAVLDQITDDVSGNICARGVEFVEKLKALQAKLPGTIVNVEGTGLLVSAELNASFPVIGFGGVEEYIRKHGVNVIHGGENSLRFTPQFKVTSAEIDLIVSVTEQALVEFASRT